MALEVRYVGNRGLRARTNYNLNEVNILENGFLDEFKLAQANLQANIKARRCLPGQTVSGCQNNFGYFGPNTGTYPLPIILRYFSGIPLGALPNPADYTSTLFANSTFVNPLALNNADPVTFAQTLYTNQGRRNNASLAGLTPNFFQVNPYLQGGATITGNGGHSYYDSAVVELRRRMSKGFLAQGSYVFARGFSLDRTSMRAPFYKSPSGLVITHAFKTDWVYDLPFGRGQKLLAHTRGPAGKVLEGWAYQGTARVQSGAPFNITGVRLVGMTRKELQKSIKVRFDDAAGIAYYLPQDIVDNTIRAFNVSATSSNGYSSRGASTGRYLAPANSANCIEVYAGQCGMQNLVLYGPAFTRFDMSLIKRTRITEKVSFEFRAEFLNTFNNINFSVGNPANATTTITGLGNDAFGRITQAYRDISTTNDPGGRIIQFVGRINW